MSKIRNKDLTIKTLSENLHKYINQLSLNTSKDDSITIAELINLKKVLSDVNGLITLKAENALVKKLAKLGIISREECDKALTEKGEGNPYSNGYDVVIKHGNLWIAAEIKCNIPVGEKKFGAAQEKSIIKDILGLHDPSLKKKGQKKILSSKFIKIVAILNVNDSVAESVDKTIAKVNNSNHKKIAKLYKNGERLNPDIVYVLLIEIDELDNVDK